MRAAALVQQPNFFKIIKYLWGLVKFHTDSKVCELLFTRADWVKLPYRR